MRSWLYVYVTDDETPDLMTQDPVEALEMFLHAVNHESSAILRWSA